MCILEGRKKGQNDCFGLNPRFGCIYHVPNTYDETDEEKKLVFCMVRCMLDVHN